MLKKKKPKAEGKGAFKVFGLVSEFGFVKEYYIEKEWR